MKTYKDLYLAKNMKALELVIYDKDFKNKLKKVEHVLKKMYEGAQQNVTDQELMYIYLSRLFIVYNLFREVHNDEKYVELMYGQLYKKAKYQFDELKKNLEERYVSIAKAVETTPRTLSTFEPESPPEPETSSVRIFEDEFITCAQLYSALQKFNLLLVDARSEYDFSQSRIEISNIINVPERCISSGLSANTLGQRLPSETQKIWEKRDSYDVLVLLDWNSSADNFIATKLDKLRTALVEFDLNRNYSERPVVLDGGYLELLQTYPFMCTNPQVILSRKNNELDELLDIDNIIYPTESDNWPHGNTNDNQLSKVEIEDDSNISREFLIRENRELTLDIEETVAKLVIAEEEYKQINEQINGELETNNLEKLKDKEKVEDQISQLEEHLDQLNAKKDDIEEKYDLFAHFDPAKEAIRSNDVEIVPRVGDPEIDEVQINRAIQQEKFKALEQARALKPKLNEFDIPNKHRESSPDYQRPVINRSTKPKFPLELPNVLVDPLSYTTPGTIGLKNIRNTCYMNTVIQCLKNISSIRDLFCNGTYYSKYNLRRPAAIILETARLIRYLWSKPKSIEPFEFYKRVCALEPTYGQGNHEDCMEFFLFLLNHLSEDCTYDADRGNILTPMQIAWCNQFQGKNSVFINLFYHQIRIQQHCPACPASTQKFELESTFMLSVPDSEFNLETLMAEYMADFVIPEYRCSKCKKPVINKKKIIRYPDIAVLVLKRYKQILHNGNVTIRKIESKSNFPKTNFKLGNKFYNLNSIAMHAGDINHGHYTAVCLTQEGWYEFNDEIVRPVDINDEAIKVKAVAFFYSICD